MSDFSQLIKNKITVQNTQNKLLAEQKCHEADKLVMRASKSSNNKGLLMVAMDLYSEAISYHSKCVSAYFGMSAICYSISEYKETAKIMNTILEIDPGNTKAKNFLNDLKIKIKNEAIREINNKSSAKSLDKHKKNKSVFSFSDIFSSISNKNSSKSKATSDFKFNANIPMDVSERNKRRI